MKVIELPKNFYPILGCMQLRDKFWLKDGKEFELVVEYTFPRKFGVRILTFRSEGKDYKCNVWHGKDVFYMQEV
jgi:hypothetical protein